MTARQHPSTIVIDLTQDEIALAKNNSPDAALQRDGWKKLEKLINDQIKSAKSKTEYKVNDISYPRQHRAILIEGGRGSGKTTFTLNFLNRLALGAEDGISEHVHVLPMVDPTLIETKDNVIVVLMQMIEAAIDEKEKQSGSTGKTLTDLDTAREDLAEGLRLLDGIGQKEAYGAEWEDATWVMSEGLRRAKKGRSFEVKFNVYLEKALAVLEKKIFILAFDDVDTNFMHGYTVLETIRKYLTSPQLTLLISGDLELYGRLLRRKIYENFGRDVMEYDQKAKLSILTAVRELEEQYLLKVLPPQNRIKMLPLGGLSREIKVLPSKSEKPDQPPDLNDWASLQILRQLRESKSVGRHPFLQVILREHLRLVIGYLRALDFDLNDTNALNESRSAVLKVFETRLRMGDVSTELLDVDNLEAVLLATFRWLVDQDEPAALIRFDSPGDGNRALILHCLALAMAQGLGQAGANLKALFMLALPVAMLKRTRLSGIETRKQVFAYLWRQAKPFLPEVAARIGAIDRGEQNVAKVAASSFGSVGLAGGSIIRDEIFKRLYDVDLNNSKLTLNELLDKAPETETSAYRWLRNIDEKNRKDLDARFGTAWFTLEDLMDSGRCGKFGDILSLIFFKRFSARGETFRSISALSLFAVIGELLSDGTVENLPGLSFGATIPTFGIASQADEKEDTDGVGKSDAVSDQSEDDDGNNPTETSKQGDDTPETEESYAVFSKKLESWLKFANNRAEDTALSPAQLGALAMRLHDDLLAFDEVVTSTWGSGEILHRQITNILNAVVAITAGTVGRKESPKTSDLPLFNALSGIQGAGLHRLSVILLSCPLIWIFLNPGDEKVSALREKVKEVLTTLQPVNADDPDNFKGDWIDPPVIKIKISRIVDGISKRHTNIHGFYDLLNVVPRYGEQQQGQPRPQSRRTKRGPGMTNADPA